MADYTVYVNASSFTKDSPTGPSIDINPLNYPNDVEAQDTITFKLGPSRTAATSVEVDPDSPPLFTGNNRTFTVPTGPNGITLTITGAAKNHSYELSLDSTEGEGFTGKIKVN